MKVHSMGHLWFSTPACLLPLILIAVFTYIGPIQPHTLPLLQGHAQKCFRQMPDTIAGIFP